MSGENESDSRNGDQPAEQETTPDRYWLFCGHTYYPHGGFDDFYGSFNDIERATARATELEAERQFDWLSIIDIYVRKQVWPREWEID